VEDSVQVAGEFTRNVVDSLVIRLRLYLSFGAISLGIVLLVGQFREGGRFFTYEGLGLALGAIATGVGIMVATHFLSRGRK
jgi:hypothetical protein